VSSVRHITIAKSARLAFDVNHLWPLITHSSPSRTARVRSERGSEPGASGSVMAKQLCIVPATSGSSHFFFCSGVPYLSRIFWLPEFGARIPKIGFE
jgi:hypothetical protein